jgi:hypothetical protein
MKLKQISKCNVKPHVKQMGKFMTLFGDWRVIGTASLSNMNYVADFDLDELIHTDKNLSVYLDIYNKFLQKFIQANKDKNVFITDFKCGIHRGNIPLRWDLKSMTDGFQMIDDEKYLFTTALEQESVCKLDMVLIQGSEIHEFSENYYFYFGNSTNFNTELAMPDKIIHSLTIDTAHKMNEGKYLKALKRMFSILRIIDNPADDKQMEIMMDFFNSHTGKLSTIANDLETLASIFSNVPISQINKVLDTIYKKAEPFNALADSVDSIRKTKTKKNKLRALENSVKMINEQVNSQAFDFLQIHDYYSHMRFK